MHLSNQLSAVRELTEMPEWGAGIQLIPDAYISIHEHCLTPFPAYEISQTADLFHRNAVDYRKIDPKFLSRRRGTYITAGYTQLNLKHKEGLRNIYAVSIIPYDDALHDTLTNQVPLTHLSSILLLETGVLSTMYLNQEKRVATMSSFHPHRMQGYGAHPYPSDYNHLRRLMLDDLVEPYSPYFEATIRTADLALHAHHLFMNNTQNKESLVKFFP